MTKKLKIRFVKFEKALVMQILEQVGEFKESKHVKFDVPYFWCKEVHLRGAVNISDFDIANFTTDSNAERDEYLTKVVGWITDEQFTSTRPIAQRVEPKIDGDIYTWEMEVAQ